MRQAVPGEMVEWSATRLWQTFQHYRRRAWRWNRVLVEWRPGLVRPARGRERVLVVRLDAIGDFVLWSGAARALRDWLGPERHVTLMANAAWADLARDADIADEVWPVRRRELEHDSAYRTQLRRRVQGERFSIAINPRHTREMLYGDSVMRWSRAPLRIGSYGEGHLLPPLERKVADEWYTRLVQPSPAVMHETMRNAEFLRAIGVPLSEVPAPRLHVYPRPLPGLDDLPNGYFVVFPGASLVEKQWSPARFAEVAAHVVRRTGWTPIVVGDTGERAVTAAVAARVPGAIDVAGETSIPVLASAIQRCKLVLTNDTSAVHIAAATGVPAVCVVGGWQWERFVPYPAALGEVAERIKVVSMEQEMACFNCGWDCTQPHVPGTPLPCVERVPVARVIWAVEEILNRMNVGYSNG